MDFYDIDEGKVGPIIEKDTLAFSSDGSVITSKEYAIGPRKVSEDQREELYSSKFLGYVSIHGTAFGFENDELWFSFSDKTRAVCELGTMTLTIPDLSIKFTNNEVLQELSSMNLRIELGGLSELNRAITGKGTVIRYLEDSIQILFANGNVSYFKDET
jgi:hypothetical protein